ncbi:hypothetical protein P691DRAFT_330690 [Macrolepiota fuliginosa MF-IS2]|uniref:Uncharacterized protein n=1 Tax=Macrolepiota fuliginosa MF-IS2 TaxID=1400762 RepID=A0A9P5XIY7_9AGAR|nr:hypothetical protein P691DRAFT_330690 [Macrolepiota fuliginosa MF-IS2]
MDRGCAMNLEADISGTAGTIREVHGLPGNFRVRYPLAGPLLLALPPARCDQPISREVVESSTSYLLTTSCHADPLWGFTFYCLVVFIPSVLYHAWSDKHSSFSPEPTIYHPAY